MTWIKTIPYENADSKLKQLYDRIKGPDNNVDKIMLGLSPEDTDAPDNWSHK